MLFFALTEQQSDRRLVVGVGKQVVHRRHVHPQLAKESRLESHGLEFDDDVAAELQVVEEQVAVELVAAHFETDLSADEREPLAEFQQERRGRDRPGLDSNSRSRLRSSVEEVEDVRVLGGLLGQVGVLGRHRSGEVGDGLAGALVQPDGRCAGPGCRGPAVRDRLGRVP